MIAFLGMGLLGSNFVRALVERGESVRIFNRTEAKARALAEELGGGVTVHTDVAEAVAGVRRVHLVLKDDASVDDVLVQAEGGLVPGTTLVDHTTTSTAGTVTRAAAWQGKGMRFLHAPVFMGPQNCREATGIMIAAGPAALFEELRPELEPMTGKLLHLGEAPDRAAAFKLMGNLIILSMTSGLMDGLALARSMGLDRSDLGSMLEWFNPGASMPRRLERVLQEPWDNASWELAMARKDAGLMLEEAAAAGVPLFVMPAVAARMDERVAEGHAASDWTVIAKNIFEGWES